MIPIERRNANLDEAKALVLKGWCQQSYAKDASGRDVQFDSERAVCFCMAGAVYRAAGSWDQGGRSPERLAIDAALSKLNCPPTTCYNDAEGRTKSEVAAIFDHAKEMPL